MRDHITRPPHAMSVITTCLLLAACGGGGDAAPGAAAVEPLAALAVPADPAPVPPPAPVQVQAVPAATLATLPRAPTFTNRSWGATPQCAVAYVPGNAPTTDAPAALPADGAGAMYSAAELSTWRTRVRNGPFLFANDFTVGSPGDWQRISANAAKFLTTGEVLLTPANQSGLRSTHGTLVRDAAFVMLITGDAAQFLPKIRDHLLRNLEDPLSDYTLPCYRDLGGQPAADVFYTGAHWFIKLLVTYDFVRNALPSTDRLRIERAILKQAHAFTTHLDEALRANFPQRTAGDYAVTSRDAAATGEKRWYPKPIDLNGDCQYDATEQATLFPSYAYVRADGGLGPRLSVLSQWYNNRRSGEAAMVGLAAALLNHGHLAERSKRYFFEWLTYGMAADGSDGEFVRNGNYCLAKQGTIYQHSTLQGALLAARALARRDDRDLYRFVTRDGLYGTDAPLSQPAKSLETAVKMQLDLVQQTLPWYMHEPQYASQAPREQTFLGRMEGRYMNGPKETDNFHELGLLLSAGEFPNLPVAKVVLRDGLPAPMRFPGSTGNAVATGLGAWSDALGAMPAVFLLRP
jgi:hypothetical protein